MEGGTGRRSRRWVTAAVCGALSLTLAIAPGCGRGRRSEVDQADARTTLPALRATSLGAERAEWRVMEATLDSLDGTLAADAAATTCSDLLARTDAMVTRIEAMPRPKGEFDPATGILRSLEEFRAEIGWAQKMWEALAKADAAMRALPAKAKLAKALTSEARLNPGVDTEARAARAEAARLTRLIASKKAKAADLVARYRAAAARAARSAGAWQAF